MFYYALKRLFLMVPTVLGVLLVTFAVVQFVPGGPVEQDLAEAKAGAGTSAEGGLSYRGAQGVDPKRIEQAKALYGFDKPAPERFWQMLVQFARFDLGKSFFQNRDVGALIVEGDFAFGRDVDALFGARPDNIFLMKVSYWLNP